MRGRVISYIQMPAAMWQRRETKTPLEAMAGVAKYVAGVAKYVAGVHFRAPVQRNP